VEGVKMDRKDVSLNERGDYILHNATQKRERERVSLNIGDGDDQALQDASIPSSVSWLLW